MKSAVVQLLNRPGLRHILGWILTVYVTLRERHLIWIYPEDDVWLYRVKDFYFALDRIQLPNETTAAYLKADRRSASALLPRITDTPLQPGSTVVDIGAGVGHITYVWSKILGPKGKILSVEAHPRTFSCLEKNCNYNKLTNVILENCAVMDVSGNVVIDDMQNYEAAHVFSGTGQKVTAKTVDELVKHHGIKRIDLLYMNIEGAERLAVKGMSASIAKTRYALIGCHDFRADKEGLETMRTKSIVVEFLMHHGFRTVTRKAQSRTAYEDFVLGWNPSLEDELPEGFEKKWPFSTFFDGQDLSFS